MQDIETTQTIKNMEKLGNVKKQLSTKLGLQPEEDPDALEELSELCPKLSFQQVCRLIVFLFFGGLKKCPSMVSPLVVEASVSHFCFSISFYLCLSPLTALRYFIASHWILFLLFIRM